MLRGQNGTAVASVLLLLVAWASAQPTNTTYELGREYACCCERRTDCMFDHSSDLPASVPLHYIGILRSFHTAIFVRSRARPAVRSKSIPASSRSKPQCH